MNICRYIEYIAHTYERIRQNQIKNMIRIIQKKNQVTVYLVLNNHSALLKIFLANPSLNDETICYSFQIINLKIHFINLNQYM